MTVEGEVMREAVALLDRARPSAARSCTSFIRIRQTGRSATQWTARGHVLGTLTAVVDVEGLGAWPCPRDVFVHRAVVASFVSGGKNSPEPYEFSLSGDALRIRCGSRVIEAELVGEVHGYGEVARPGDGVEFPTTLERALRTASKFAMTDPCLPFINCVWLDRSGLAMATDRVSMCAIDTGHVGSRAVAVPLGCVESMRGAGRLVVGRKGAALEFPMGRIHAKVPDEARRFPARIMLGRLAEADGPALFRAPVEAALAAVRALGPLSKFSPKDRIAVTFDASRGGPVSLTASSRVGAAGAAVIDGARAERKTSFSAPHDQLRAALEALASVGDEVEFGYRAKLVALRCGGKATALLSAIE